MKINKKKYLSVIEEFKDWENAFDFFSVGFFKEHYFTCKKLKYNEILLILNTLVQLNIIKKRNKKIHFASWNAMSLKTYNIKENNTMYYAQRFDNEAKTNFISFFRMKKENNNFPLDKKGRITKEFKDKFLFYVKFLNSKNK